MGTRLLIPTGCPATSEIPAQRERLVCVEALAGAAQHEHATHHYVVETDVHPDHERDFNEWYGQEHLPGLAAGPGTVRAARYVREASPRYHACYDLVSPDIVGCDAWLAVRNTAWSSRVRPQFRNTQRTMFRRLAAAPRPADDLCGGV